MSLAAFASLALLPVWTDSSRPPADYGRVEVVKVKPSSRLRTRLPAEPTVPFRPADQEDRAREAMLAPATPPAQAAEPPPPPPQWSDAEVIEALKSCLSLLAPIAAEVELSAPLREDRCGTAAPVVLHRIRTSTGTVEFRPAPQMNCRMVAGLHRWIEATLQPTSVELLGSPVMRITNSSSYACRNRNNAADGPISEHAFANAVDIGGFVTADGRRVEVVKDWGETHRDAKKPGGAESSGSTGTAKKGAADHPRLAELAKGSMKDRSATNVRSDSGRSGLGANPPSPVLKDARPDGEKPDGPPKPSVEAQFLRRLHSGACGVFSTVLGPEANEAHRDHFHFDMAPRRRGSFCE
jgi:hypothetical protein